MKYLVLLFTMINVTVGAQNASSDFIADSTGCLGLRAKYMEPDLRKKLFYEELKSKTKEEVIKYLGTPNEYCSRYGFKKEWNELRYYVGCRNPHPYYSVYFRRNGKVKHSRYKPA